MLWLISLLALRIQSVVSGGPPLPYVDNGACPFECCTYRDWTAEVRLTAYKQYESRGRRELAFTLKTGERVTAMTGVVITASAARVRIIKPVTLEVHSRRFPKAPVERISLSPGDRVYLLTPLGEGWMSGWADGRLLESFDAADFADTNFCSRNPRCSGVVENEANREWWIKVRNSRGQIGWVLMPRKGPAFGNTDACG